MGLPEISVFKQSRKGIRHFVCRGLTAAFMFSTASFCGALESFLPPNGWSIPADALRDGGLSQEQFDAVLDAVEAVYAADVAERGGRLVIERLWDDPTVNAKAKRNGQSYIIQMFGGLARHWTVTQDGFALVACHELGHHLGGWPRKRPRHIFSNEGQADYFANLKCLRRVFSHPLSASFTRALEENPVASRACSASFARAEDRALCLRGALAGISIANMFRVLGQEAHEPRLDTPDPGQVPATVNTHPDSQCRLDTYFQGSLCPQPASVPLDYNDAAPGACTRSQGFYVGLRPRCWYKPPAGEPEGFVSLGPVFSLGALPSFE
jgi:hypothetical protein